jgi:hypothetical protein
MSRLVARGGGGNDIRYFPVVSSVFSGAAVPPKKEGVSAGEFVPTNYGVREKLVMSSKVILVESTRCPRTGLHRHFACSIAQRIGRAVV